MKVRVRIAPSPTGEPHIGTAHTALFNWLFARHHGGTFVVRIEDTDRARLMPGAVESIKEMLRWLDLDPDEGPGIDGDYSPYFQSERLGLYEREIQTLLANRRAYHCYCSSERLAAVNLEKQRQKLPPGYDRHCRFLSDAERAAAAAKGVRPVVRLAVPLDGTTSVHDAVRDIKPFDNALLQDAVLMKSDGWPTYHFAATVDDHFMEITHVLRGDEWINSTPLHLIICDGFGWTPPVFAHLPLLLGKDKAKLSKRHGDTAFKAFVEQGYLPDALFNFLGLLGWSLDDKTEILDRTEFVTHFDLNGIVKSPAVFDFEKLRWMNGVYIRALPAERFACLVEEWLARGLPPRIKEQVTPELVRRLAPLLQTRVLLLSEIAPMVLYFFEDGGLQYDRDTLLGKRFAASPDDAMYALEEVCSELEDIEDWDKDTIEEVMRKVADRRGIKLRDFTAPFFVAISGRTQALPLFESMALLGKRETLERLQRAIDRLRP